VQVKTTLPASTWLRSLVLTAVLVFATSWACIVLTAETDRVATIWLANGLLLGILLTTARSRQWAALLAAGFAGNVAANLVAGDGVEAAFGLSICNSLEVAISCLLLHLRRSSDKILFSRRALLDFTVTAVLLAPVASAMLAAVVLSRHDWSAAIEVASHWYAADALGMAIVAPLVMALRLPAYDTDRLLRFGNLLAIVLILVVATGVFMQTRYPFLFLVFPPLTLLSVRAGYRGATTGVAIITVFAIASIVLHTGPLMLIRGIEAHEQILILQVFVAVTVISSLPIAAMLQRERFLKASLGRTEQALRSITDNVPALICYIDAEERFRFVSSYFTQLLRRLPSSMLGRCVREIWGDEVYARQSRYVDAALEGNSIRFEAESVIDGLRIHQLSSYVPDRAEDGTVRGFYAITFDITELKQTQNQLDQLARFDTLTGLANRREFDERLHEAVARAARFQRPLALLFIDVDHFKSINDTLGHAAGDAVLREFGRRLLSCVRSTDLAARWAGDEFIVLIELDQPSDAPQQVARNILSAIAEPFDVGNGETLAVGTSIGIVVQADVTGTSAEQLMAHADRSLYAAKNAGRGSFHELAI
jgi:diguanylate cyclase (GGDEF)-like protein/PAS domain S-box-containing protein